LLVLIGSAVLSIALWVVTGWAFAQENPIATICFAVGAGVMTVACFVHAGVMLRE
jgi:hypothetical protein